MKKRIAIILTVLCFLLQLCPFASFAVSSYELYVGGQQFTSFNLALEFDNGEAVYNPYSKTLTLSGLIEIDGDNTAVYSEISGLTIVIRDEVYIEINRTGSIGGAAVPFFGMLLTENTTITGGNDLGLLRIDSKNSYSSLNMGNFTCYGIQIAKDKSLEIEGCEIIATDISASDYAGKFAAISSRGSLTILNSVLTVKKAYSAIYDEYEGHDVSVSNTDIDFDCTGVGIYMNTGTKTFSNVRGKITSPIGICSYGTVNLKNSSSGKPIAITSTSKGIDCQSTTFNQSGLLTVSAPKGISLTKSAFNSSGGTTDVSFTSAGIFYEDDTSSVNVSGGTVKLTGNSGTSTVGILAQGSFTQSGGTLTVSGVNAGMQSYAKDIAFTGGTTAVTAVGAGYASASSANLKISDKADITVTAPIGIQLTKSTGGKLTLSGGTVKLNVSNKGLNIVSGAGAVNLNGGTLTVTGTSTTGNVFGIYAESAFTVNGATLNFKDLSFVDIYVCNHTDSSVKAGTVKLSSPQFGMGLFNNFTVSGGNINYSGSGVGLYCSGGTYNFSGGNITYTGSNVGIYCAGGTYNFSGGKVDLSSSSYPLTTDPDYTSTLNFSGTNTILTSTSTCALGIFGTGTSYSVSGGSVSMLSTSNASTAAPSSVASGYSVYAGDSEATAKLVASPVATTYLGNKFVKIYKPASVTLTIVNAKEGSTLTAVPGTSVSYTAKDADSGKHFAYWNLTVNGKTEKVGTNAVYTGTMPVSNATLTAVYENCSGGTATCQHKAICSVCKKEYGNLAAHSYKTNWSSDSTQHWHECSVCNAKKDTAAHIYDNDCDTTCNVCGATRSVTHSYQSKWSSDSVQHWHECSVCHDKKDTAAHVYDNDCDTTCNVCGATRSVTHSYQSKWSSDGTQHWHECSVCHAKADTAAHVYDNACDTTCNVCGATRSVTHSYQSKWSSDGTQHWHECSVCHDKKDTAAHIYDNACDTTCNVCGATRSVTHSYQSKWSSDGTQHWHECSVCHDKKDTAAHIYDNDTDMLCNVCGHDRSVKYLLGDVNGDGEIKLADAMMAFKYVAKTGTLTTDEFTRADCNKDGEVKLADAMAIFKYVAKVTDKVEF